MTRAPLRHPVTIELAIVFVLRTVLNHIVLPSLQLRAGKFELSQYSNFRTPKKGYHLHGVISRIKELGVKVFYKM